MTELWRAVWFALFVSGMFLAARLEQHVTMSPVFIASIDFTYQGNFGIHPWALVTQSILAKRD